MSSYVNFFIRVNDNIFIPIASYGRSSQLYGACNYMPYGKVKALSETELNNIYATLQESINYIDRQREKYLHQRDVISKFNNSVDEKYELICDIENSLDELVMESQEIYAAQSFVQTLVGMINEIRFQEDENVAAVIDADHYIYCGIEAPYKITEEDIV